MLENRINMGYVMKRLHPFAVTLLAASPFAGSALPGNAQAQDSGALEEIVVTAQRRTENLQNVPISITAFSAEALERTHVLGATDYMVQTPNVSFTEDAQSGARGVGVAIRGINNLVSGENAFVNSVGVYLDEFSIASVPNGFANPLLPDMERVEVLRGPQGTYFGRNSLGGALNLTSKAPTDKYEGEIKVGGQKFAGYGNAENITAIYNAPLTDSFKLRGTVFYEHSTGMVENINPSGNDAGHDWVDLRVRGLWTPSDATRINLTLMYSNQDQGADETVPSGVNDLDTIDTFAYQPGVGFNPGTGFWPNNTTKFSHDLQEKNKLKTFIGIVNVAHSFSDTLTWKTVAGIIDSKQDRLFDNDLIGGADILKRTNKYKGKSYSLESRLEWRTEAMDLTGGAMYAKDKQDQDNNVAVSSDPTASIVRDGITYGFLPPFPEGLGLAKNSKVFKVDSFAAFADVTWHANAYWDLFAGARYTNDDVTNGRTSYGLRPNGGGPPTFINFARPDAISKDKFSAVTPRVGVRLKASDNVNFYALVSKGYKAGGASTGNNTNAPGSPAIRVPFNKETLWNYEAGVKTEFLDHRVRMNASVFYMKWKDLQMEAFRFLTPGDLSSNFEQTINVPRAVAKGAEFEITARTTDRLTLGGSIGFLDTEIMEDQACAVSALDPDCVDGHKPSEITGGFKVFLKGLPIPKSPKTTVNLFAEYRIPVMGNSAWIRGELQHRDSQYSDIEALTNQQTTGPSPNQGLTRLLPNGEFPYKVPAFTVYNLRGGFDWDRAAVSLYVQNLANAKYYTGTQENFGLSGIRLRPHPRTIGADVTFKF